MGSRPVIIDDTAGSARTDPEGTSHSSALHAEIREEMENLRRLSERCASDPFARGVIEERINDLAGEIVYPLRLPSEHVEPATVEVAACRRGVYTFRLSPEQIELLEKLASRLGVSIEQVVGDILRKAMEEESVMRPFDILLEWLSASPRAKGSILRA